MKSSQSQSKDSSGVQVLDAPAIHFDHHLRVHSAGLPEPPVVARLVVEIRSDGTATIARAGLSDDVHDERTVFEARGSTPLALAVKLARHLLQLSLIGPRAAARSMLSPGPRRSPPR